MEFIESIQLRLHLSLTSRQIPSGDVWFMEMETLKCDWSMLSEGTTLHSQMEI